MKHIKKFNESNENGSKDIQISMADLENINHNLAGYDNNISISSAVGLVSTDSLNFLKCFITLCEIY